jgi:putative acetyltransferase
MITYKTFEPSHESQLIAMITNIQQNEFQVPVTLADQPDLQTIPTFYQVKNGQFWVALHNDTEVIGSIALIDCGKNVGCIRKMFVKAEFRGEYGIAQQLLDILTTHAQSYHITDLYLGTVAKLKAAIRFYERNGFSPVEKNDIPSVFPFMAVDTHFFGKKIQ